MKTLLRAPLAVLITISSLGLLLEACATTPTAPTGPIELDGSRWKLMVLASNIDGRVIEFKKRGKEGYIGTLVEPGRRLADVMGLQMGVEIFNLRRTGENQYSGIYKSISGNGDIADREVIVTVNGNTLNWNQESANWERIQ